MKKHTFLFLRNQLTKSHIFLFWSSNNTNTNAFNPKNSHIWNANTDIQFLLNPYVVATYYTSHMTKLDKNH
jgi:hypothetical protein